MHANRGLSLGIVLAAVITAACNPTGSATTAPTAGTPTTAPGTAAATSAPVVTLPPATSAPSFPAGAGAFAVFEPKAGGTPAVQGGAALFDVNGKTQIVIGVVSTGSETMAASIQAGTCDNLTPEAAHRLTDVVAGASTTTVDVALATLLASPYAINISVAGSETESSITCGEIQPIPTP